MQKSDFTQRLCVLAAQYGANSYDPYFSRQEQFKGLSQEEVALLLKSQIKELVREKHRKENPD